MLGDKHPDVRSQKGAGNCTVGSSEGQFLGTVTGTCVRDMLVSVCHGWTL